jgi:hypothetical protein
MVQCPFCEDLLKLTLAGWAYRYTEMLLHLDRCAPQVSERERQRAARVIAAAD